MDRFCFLAAPTFLYSSLYRYLGGYLGKSEFNRKSSSDSGDRNFSFSNICCNNTSAQFVVLVEIQKRQCDGHQASLPTKYMEGCDSHVLLWMIPFLFHLLLFAIYVTKKNKLKEIMKAELKIEEEPLFFIISLWGDAKLILITVNELNRVWENHVKSKPFSDNRTP